MSGEWYVILLTHLKIRLIYEVFYYLYMYISIMDESQNQKQLKSKQFIYFFIADNTLLATQNLSLSLSLCRFI